MGSLKVLFSVMVVAATGTIMPRAGAEAATYHVPGDFATIQEAVEGASPGDTVIVKEGTYRENVTIAKPLTLKSEDRASSTIVEAALKDEPVFMVSGVEGFTLTGFTATGSSRAGILIEGSSNGTVSGNISKGNFNGILVYTSKDLAIMGNYADSNENYGIYLERSDGNTIEGNTASRNKDRGIFLSYSGDNAVVDNSANLNAWNGITLWESHGNSIRDNVTFRNTYGIVVGSSRDNEITGNSTWPNIYIILPIVLIYIGILSYLLQKNILKMIYR